MELIRGLYNLRPAQRGCVATIGTYDGVHLGHQRVLRLTRELARLHRLPVAVVTFEPQPLEFLAPEQAPPRLTPLREKCQLLAHYGVERVLLLRFDRWLASLAPREFVERLLVEGLGVRHLVVGDDFRFGTGRGGDFTLLEALGENYGFEVQQASSCRVDGVRVSSTHIRGLLEEGEIAAAERMLGHPYHISGRVQQGFRRGREIGYPTINIAMRRRRSPVSGIFAVRVLGLEEGPHYGAAYIGHRPVIEDDRLLLEVHLFDFDRECYGRHVKVELIEKIREERPFDDFQTLRRQIDEDVARAREIIERHESN